MTSKIFQHTKIRPQAIFTSAITLLEGLLLYARDGSEILKQTRIITYDDHPMLNYLQTPILSVRQNAEEIAKKSFEMMHGILEENREISQILISPKLVLR